METRKTKEEGVGTRENSRPHIPAVVVNTFLTVTMADPITAIAITRVVTSAAILIEDKRARECTGEVVASI